jgi:hypothetical protein
MVADAFLKILDLQKVIVVKFLSEPLQVVLYVGVGDEVDGVIIS